ncbi:MAG: hypothetical protein GW911_33925 [Armatimonadetes bacterium]|nr:hypothetical protein [Armatimonadota bacterium]
MSQRRYSMEDEIDRALNCRAAAAELPSAINEMTVAAWDALIAAGRAALRAAEEQEHDADVAAALMRNGVDALNANCQSIRAIAKAQFKRSNAVVAGQFESTPASAKAPEDILSRAVAVNAAWSHVPTPDTWEPIPALTRAAFAAKIAEAETLVKTAVEKEKTASLAAAQRLEKAAELHDANVVWYAVAKNSFPAGSPERTMIEGTVTHHHQSEPGPQPPDVS